MEVRTANESDFPRGTDWEALEERYKKLHPEYNGEKICCEYPGY